LKLAYTSLCKRLIGFKKKLTERGLSHTFPSLCIKFGWQVLKTPEIF
jgi:hypothetical protein